MRHKGIFARRKLLSMQRVQLGGVLLLAVALPLAILMAWGIDPNEQAVKAAVAGNICALVLGHYMLRSLTAFPGISAGTFILPSFAISYALSILVFWALRFDYSRFIFMFGFLASILWYATILMRKQNVQSLRIGIVPFGGAESLSRIEKVRWGVLKSTDVDKVAHDAIAADFRADLPDEWERFLADSALRGITVYHYKQLMESLTGRVEIDHLSENNFGSLIPALLYVELKQIVDFVTALVASVLLAPLFLVVAIAVKIDSPGPILFRQERVGAGGRTFKVNKFRTMTHDESRTPMTLDEAITLAGDLRVTRLGRFLRRTRIDELPQVVNILAGEMSWIGPRPEAAVLSQWYESELPFYRYRHIVKPGITGWAQVHQGHVANVDEVLLKLNYDFYYIKNFSPWLDILILLKTAKTVMTGFGAR